MKKIILSTLLLLTVTFSSEARTKIGDLYYNLNATTKTAEVTYEYNESSTNYPTLTSVTIPTTVTDGTTIYSVTSIGNSAFEYCSKLTSVTCEATTPPSVGSDAFFKVFTFVPVYVPCDSVSAYKKASGWNHFTNFQAIDSTQCSSAVENATIANAKIYTQGKQIIIAFENSQAADVQIYSANGKLVYSSASGDVDFYAPQSGVYIVKIGSQSTKVIVK